MPKAVKVKTVVPVISTNTGISRAGWKIDYSALKVVRDIEMQEKLGIEMLMQIELPIVFRFQSGRHTWGTHRVKKDDQGNLYHSITINQNRPIDEANETIWHELTHCWQSEDWAKNARNWLYTAEDFYNFSYKRHGMSGEAYYQNPYEIQAREVAEKNKTFRLLKEV